MGGGGEGSLQEGEHRRTESRWAARIPCQAQLHTHPLQAPPHPLHGGRSPRGAGNHHQTRQPLSLLLRRAQHSSMFSRFLRTQTLHQSLSVPSPQLLTTQSPHASHSGHSPGPRLTLRVHPQFCKFTSPNLCLQHYLSTHSFILSFIHQICTEQALF